MPTRPIMSNNLRHALHAAVDAAVYEWPYQSPTTVSGPDVQDIMVRQSDSNDPARLRLLRDLTPPTGPIEGVEEALSAILVPFLGPPDQQRTVGFLVPYAFGSEIPPLLNNLSRSFVHVAVVLGPDAVVNAIEGWLDGEPLTYQNVLTIRGVTLKESNLKLADGVRFEIVPQTRVGTVALHLPDEVTPDHIVGPALVIDRKVEGPVFFPTDAPPRRHLFPPDDPLCTIQEIDRLMDTMTLVCAHPVYQAHAWRRYDELLTLIGASNSFSWRWSRASIMASAAHLTHARLEEIKTLLPKMERRPDMIGRAVSRYRNSFTEPDLDDRFIELRILLEWLYTRGVQDELSFRVALHGAWHLRRRDVFDLFRATYDEASKAMHGGKTKRTIQERRDIAERAQLACRDAILQFIDRPEDINFQTKDVIDDLLCQRSSFT